MDKVNYEKHDFNIGNVCVGLIVLQTDEVVESDLRAWLPDNYTLYHTRIANQDTINEHTVLEMRDNLPAVCQLLPVNAPIEVVAYCCTSGATVIGESVVEKAVQQVFPNARVTNPITAAKAYLNHFNARNIGLLTPYVPTVTSAMSEHLEEHGFSIQSEASFFEESDLNVCRISSDSIAKAVDHVVSNAPASAPCEAVFASCTNLRTRNILDDLSTKHGIPVVSSNAALAWHIAQLSEQPIIS